MSYYDLVFVAGAEIGQSLIVFLLIAITFDFIRRCLFNGRD